MNSLPAAPWAQCFEDPDRPGHPATIHLQQVSRKEFILGSSLKYTGATGLAALPEEALVLRPSDLGDPAITDLASVPSALRWFVSPYDVHTPAALLHDRLIGSTNDLDVPDAQADRFFRHMLKALGVRFVRRWMMWTAVAFGTRWRTRARRPLLIIWVLAAICGMTSFAYGLISHNWPLVLIAGLAPIPLATLWGRQYGAGLTASATALWVLPPTVLGAAGFWIYWLLEKAVSALPVRPAIKGDEPVSYEHF